MMQELACKRASAQVSAQSQRYIWTQSTQFKDRLASGPERFDKLSQFLKWLARPHAASGIRAL